MKTKFFRKIEIVQTHGRASLLLALLLCPIVLSAQNGVTVSNLAVNAGTVMFNVHWDKNAMPVALWSDTVWVFVDYNNNGMMTRLPLLPGATLTTTSPGGKVIEETGNNKGVWVAGNARTNGSFSATVKLLYGAATNVAGACAYASNYPPVGEYIAAQTIKFTGTPPYEIVLKDSKSGTITRESGSPFSVPASYTVQSFSDKTGAPGIMKCLVPAITHSGGDASQTVYQNTAITAITYTASNATDIALSSGNFPTGVTGTANGLAFTISGTPSVVGTFGYAVTASHTNGCNSTASGTLTVKSIVTPPYAASAATYMLAGLTWSDRIDYTPTNCQLISSCKSVKEATYAVVSNKHYYNFACAVQHRAVMCPSPWRMPTSADILKLYADDPYQKVSAAWGDNGCCDGCASCGYKNYILGIKNEQDPSYDAFVCHNCGCRYGGEPSATRLIFVRCVRD